MCSPRGVFKEITKGPYVSPRAYRGYRNAMPSAIVLGLNSQLPQGPTPLPEWIPLVPAGPVVMGRDGRSFKNPGAARIIGAFGDRKLNIPIDVNHAEELRAPWGEESPAYGWIVELSESAGAVMGRVEWNEKGKAALNAAEYRYYSPAYRLGAEGEIQFVKSVALTNSPNLDVPGLNSEEEGEKKMFEKVLKMLGLNADANEAQVVGAVERLQAAGTEMVPKADYQTVLNRAEEAEKALAVKAEADLKAEAETAINAAIEARKIAPASREYYAAQCVTREGLNAFEGFVKTAPEVVAAGSAAPEGSASPPAGKGGLNAEEAEVARQLGIDDEEKS